MLKKERIFLFYIFVAILFAVIKIGFHLKFFHLPLFFLLLGFFSALFQPKKAIIAFLFLLPIINSTPDLFFNGYPYNYMGISLFYLSGLFMASLLKKDAFQVPGRWVKPYLYFLSIIFISTVFIFIRWSNLTLSTMAFMRDTPVTPSGDRLSFASIFPVITLFLFSISPLIYFLIKKYRISELPAFRAISTGYAISFLIGVYQRLVDPDFLAQAWWGTRLKQFNAGFSDFNAFGLFSGIIFFFSMISLFNRKNERQQLTQPLHKIVLLIISLLGIFLSGSRTAFFFILAGIIWLLISKKVDFRIKLISTSFILLLVLLLGGTLKQRISRNFESFQDLTQKESFAAALDHVSNGRVTMIRNSWSIVKKYPISGVGAGNFLFYLKYMHLGKEYLEDLTLNEYLLVLNEFGIIGLLFFLLFILKLLNKRPRNHFLVLLVLLFSLLLNNYFWFPEVIILFWTLAAFNSPNETRIDEEITIWKHGWYALLLLMFFVFNVIQFHQLHPKNLLLAKQGTYDYGFWYPEQGEKGEFRWTKEACGIYFPKSQRKRFALFCGAPLKYLPEQAQRVSIYWKGKRFQEYEFRTNHYKEFNITDAEEGFLELRISRTFNLRALDPSNKEQRDLGVQFLLIKENK